MPELRELDLHLKNHRLYRPPTRVGAATHYVAAIATRRAVAFDFA